MRAYILTGLKRRWLLPLLYYPIDDFEAGLIGDWKSTLNAADGKLVVIQCNDFTACDRIIGMIKAIGLECVCAGSPQDWIKAGLPTRDPQTKPSS